MHLRPPSAAVACALLVAVMLIYVISSAGPAGPSQVIAAQATQAVDFDKDIRPLLDAHCAKCHNDTTQKGGINLALITDANAARRHRKMLGLALDAIDLGDMPPAKEKQLAPADQQRLLLWLAKTSLLDCNDPSMRDPGPWPVRRLNRVQYDRTLFELTGITFDAGQAVGLPDDRPVTGYSTFANSLTLPAAQMEKYFDAADQILDILFNSQTAPRPRDRQQVVIWEQARAAYPKIFFTRDQAQPRVAARAIIERFASRAFRRPVTDAELERLMKLFDQDMARGRSFDLSIRTALKGVLVSPQFLLRIEADRPGVAGNATTPAANKNNAAAAAIAPAKPGAIPARPVDDYSLATRLSYFLWSSMPDDELLALARENKLSEPATLTAQVRRMLVDAKARSLTDHFASQWLQLYKLENARPSTEFFPTFNRRLRQAMHDETVTFFDGLRTDNRPILDLLHADYTYLNQDLARHYNIEGVTGQQMQRIALKPEHQRGGLLGMGSILAMTSHTSRTSPTLRGKWVLDVIYGTPPAPPPPDVGKIQEDRRSREPRSFRELLGQHASRAECSMCHRKMDPLGFALDNFDAVGAWRDNHGGKPLDTTGKLPTGESFKGHAELKTILNTHRDQFIRNMTAQMLSYALGRELDFYDDCVIDTIVKQLATDEFKFASLVEGIVRSYPFQYRRVE